MYEEAVRGGEGVFVFLFDGRWKGGVAFVADGVGVEDFREALFCGWLGGYEASLIVGPI